MTILEVLQSAAGYMKKHGVESPRLNAEHLLAHTLDKRRLDLYLEFDRVLSEEERAPLRELVKRRIAGEPLQHLLGEWDFYGRSFALDSRALIPRPETEQLVSRMLEVLPAEAALRVADVGTGSGAIALSLACERPAWAVTACDISADALALAKTNAGKLGVEGKVCWHHGDLLPEEGVWDAIAANLPYIPSEEISTLSKEVQRDPVLALDGGADGLEIIRRLITDAPKKLEKGGFLFLEFGQGQSDAIREILAVAGFGGITILEDHQGIPRIAQAQNQLL